jgi:pSer/pThr/pTyr-binding forkhead associated (FHA) protein
VGPWLKTRHNGFGAGHVEASWTDAAGNLQRREFYSPFVIGRDITSDIRLSDERVSRTHAALWAEGGRWRVRDLGSVNGTWLDGKRVSVSMLPRNCKLRLHEDGPIVELAVAAVEETVVAFQSKTVRDN